MWIPMHRRPSFAHVAKKRKTGPPNNGVFLDEPVLDKLNEVNVVLHDMEIGHSSMQGYRAHMEDQHIIDSMTDMADHILVSIMDGEYLILKMQPNLLNDTNTMYPWFFRTCR